MEIPYEIRPLPKHMQDSPYAKYYYNPNIAPQEYWDDIGDNSPKDPKDMLTIHNRSDLLLDGYLPVERGWALLDDGTATCAGIMQFPGATPEMMYWWFAWMPVDPLRGKLWEPNLHLENTITRDQLERLVDHSIPLRERMWGVHFYPIDLGVRADPNAEKAPVRVEFYPPEAFGLDPQRVKETEGDVAILCAQTGPIGQLPITSFIHTFRRTETSCELRSHFWYGWRFEDGQPVKASVNLPQ